MTMMCNGEGFVKEGLVAISRVESRRLRYIIRKDVFDGLLAREKRSFIIGKQHAVPLSQREGGAGGVGGGGRADGALERKLTYYGN